MRCRAASPVFSPHHLINYVYIALNDANYLHGYGLVHIIRAGLAQNALLLHLDCHIGSVEKLTSSNASQNKVTSLQRLRAFRTGADAHSGDGMTNGQIEATFLGQSAGVRDNCQSVHLQLIVIVEAQRLIDPDTRVEFEATLFQTVRAAGMAGVENGHIILISVQMAIRHQRLLAIRF